MLHEDPESLHRTIRACRICRETPIGQPLPIEPNPVLALSRSARILVAGQAPGNLADRTSTPFNDPSGRRLRDWMGVGPETFYDAARVAILPMGFCFPGYDAKGADRPPRRECRLTWHDRAMAAMPQIRLVLAIGLHAQRYHLGPRSARNLTDNVREWRRFIEEPVAGIPVLPLPHPSWRNNSWLKRNPWFGEELLPELRARIASLLAQDTP